MPAVDSDDLNSRSLAVNSNEPWPPTLTLLATCAAAVAIYIALRFYARDSIALSTASDLYWYALWFAIVTYVTFGDARFARRIVNAFWAIAVLYLTNLAIALLQGPPRDSQDIPVGYAAERDVVVQDFIWFACLVPFKLLIGCLLLAPLRAIWKWRIVRKTGAEVAPERKLSIADFLSGMLFTAAICGGLRHAFSEADNPLTISQTVISEGKAGLVALIVLAPLLWWVLRPKRLEDRLGIAIAYEAGVALVLAVLLQTAQGGLREAGPADFAPYLVLPATLITLAYIARRAGCRLAVGNDPNQFAAAAPPQPESSTKAF